MIWVIEIVFFFVLWAIVGIVPAILIEAVCIFATLFYNHSRAQAAIGVALVQQQAALAEATAKAAGLEPQALNRARGVPATWEDDLAEKEAEEEAKRRRYAADMELQDEWQEAEEHEKPLSGRVQQWLEDRREPYEGGFREYKTPTAEEQRAGRQRYLEWLAAEKRSGNYDRWSDWRRALHDKRHAIFTDYKWKPYESKAKPAAVQKTAEGLIGAATAAKAATWYELAKQTEQPAPCVHGFPAGGCPSCDKK
ncbi:MAG: hypothetical protein ACLPJH_16005 [Myxococcaceae bacterium]